MRKVKNGGAMSVFEIDSMRQAGRLHEVMGVRLRIAGLPPAMTPAEDI